jgi:hypothetical protein
MIGLLEEECGELAIRSWRSGMKGELLIKGFRASARQEE